MPLAPNPEVAMLRSLLSLAAPLLSTRARRNLRSAGLLPAYLPPALAPFFAPVSARTLALAQAGNPPGPNPCLALSAPPCAYNTVRARSRA